MLTLPQGESLPGGANRGTIPGGTIVRADLSQGRPDFLISWPTLGPHLPATTDHYQ